MRPAQSFRIDRRLAAVLVAIAAAGCSSSTSAHGPVGGNQLGADGSASGGQKASGGSGTSGGSNGGGGSGGASGAGGSGGASGAGGLLRDASADATFVGAEEAGTSPFDAASLLSEVTLRMTFSVPAGQEVIRCQKFPNPFGGKDAAIGYVESSSSPGIVRLIVLEDSGTFGNDVADGGTPCNGLELAEWVHFTRSTHQQNVYGPDKAIELGGATALRLNAHYFNTTGSDLRTTVTVKLGAIDATAVHRWVRSVSVISFGPGATSCSNPMTADLIGGVGMLDTHVVHFDASATSGAALYDATTWNNLPWKSFDPPVSLTGTDQIKLACDRELADGSPPLSVGESVVRDGWCSFFGQAVSDTIMPGIYSNPGSACP